MAGHGRSCPVMAGHGRSCPVMASHGRSWPVMAGHALSWPVMAGSCPNYCVVVAICSALLCCVLVVLFVVFGFCAKARPMFDFVLVLFYTPPLLAWFLAFWRMLVFGVSGLPVFWTLGFAVCWFSGSVFLVCWSPGFLLFVFVTQTQIGNITILPSLPAFFVLFLVFWFPFCLLVSRLSGFLACWCSGFLVSQTPCFLGQGKPEKTKSNIYCLPSVVCFLVCLSPPVLLLVLLLLLCCSHGVCILLFQFCFCMIRNSEAETPESQETRKPGNVII